MPRDKEKRKVYDKLRYEANKEERAKQDKLRYENNKESVLLRQKKYRESNKEKSKIRKKKYNQQNRDKINQYQKNRRKNDILFKLNDNIHRMINASLKRKNCRKKSKTTDILGCTIQEFKEHIESQFEDWMNWNNYGNPKDGIFAPNKTWDIDHQIPISTALTESEILNLNHYNNLKPLCTYYNRWVKSDKLLIS